MKERSFSSPAYRYGYNGKEKDDDNSNDIIFEFRTYLSRLGRFFSEDPHEAKYAWQSPYAYYRNCPLSIIDFLGMGDYYDKKGNHLGSDGKTKTITVGTGKNAKKKTIADDKAYVCESVEMKDGLVTSAKKSKDLGVSNTELNTFANVVSQESGGDKIESFALASAILNLKAEMGSTTLMNTYTKGGVQGYYDNKNGSKYMNNFEYSMEAAINALSGGHDYSNGAIKWDGYDFAMKGLDHIKSTTAGLNISNEHLQVFSKYSLYANYYPSNPATAGMHFATTGDNVGMCLYSSVAAHGGTIFWGKNSKDFSYPGKPIVNGINSGFGPCIEYPKIKPNESFKGLWW